MNCIIIEDEPVAREGMMALVKSRDELNLMAAFDDTVKVPQFLRDNDVQLIFMDIELPGIQGTDFARILSGKYLVIFTTAFSEYALESYGLDAIDYLLKPISIGRFNKAVDKALEFRRLHSRDMAEKSGTVRGLITVKSERRFFRIKTADISYIEALKDYLAINTSGRKVITRMTMKEITNALPGDFLRVSNSFIVNITKVEAYDNYDLYIGDKQIPIGITYRDAVLDALATK